MAGLTKEQVERQAFEDQVFQPPRTARMFAQLSRYVSRMDLDAREAFTFATMEKFYAMREQMRSPSEVAHCWELALQQAAATRLVWRIWFTWHEFKWVKGAEWRGRDCYA